ncbi:MAG: Na(+)-translocating NADH-quinone reductase subunit A [Betaproteobacteria bacterium]|nr:Na(+)-translocating NADH-quinone reductase subunit A [Betaproteobacteria bacterium]
MTPHRIRRGLDLPLAGAPARTLEAARACERVALLGADSLGLRPSLRVEAGSAVVRGQPLYEDKKNPGVLFVAPAAGTIEAVNRGERRAFQSLVIRVDATADGDPERAQRPASFAGRPVAALDRAAAIALLLESGLWTSLRERPFSHVPSPETKPRAVFVTAIDTHPHAPDVGLVLAGREEAFADGVALLAKLTDGPVYVCTPESLDPRLPADPRIRRVAFAGPHPAGTAGLHIHLLDPVDHHRRAWHVGCQDVAAIGELVATGRPDVARVVSIGGPGAARPRMLRTRLGASLDELTAGETLPGPQRVISGSVLGGRTAMGPVEGFLGRYHQQVAVVPEATERELFGYITPGRDKYSVWNVVLGRFRHGLALTTTTNGGPRAMVPIGSYERVMPFDILPTFLLRALATKDVERAEALGVLELDEEDLALATFVDPGKTEWGPLLREMLERLRKEESEA